MSFGSLIVVKKDGSEGSKFPLFEGIPCQLGPGLECQVRFGSGGRHETFCAVSMEKQGTIKVSKLSTHDVIVNEATIRTPKAIKTGDYITIGPRKFRYEVSKKDNADRTVIGIPSASKKKVNKSAQSTSGVPRISGRRSLSDFRVIQKKAARRSASETLCTWEESNSPMKLSNPTNSADMMNVKKTKSRRSRKSSRLSSDIKPSKPTLPVIKDDKEQSSGTKRKYFDSSSDSQKSSKIPKRFFGPPLVTPMKPKQELDVEAELRKDYKLQSPVNLFNMKTPAKATPKLKKPISTKRTPMHKDLIDFKSPMVSSSSTKTPQFPKSKLLSPKPVTPRFVKSETKNKDKFIMDNQRAASATKSIPRLVDGKSKLRIPQSLKFGAAAKQEVAKKKPTPKKKSPIIKIKTPELWVNKFGRSPVTTKGRTPKSVKVLGSKIQKTSPSQAKKKSLTRRASQTTPKVKTPVSQTKSAKVKTPTTLPKVKKTPSSLKIKKIKTTPILLKKTPLSAKLTKSPKATKASKLPEKLISPKKEMRLSKSPTILNLSHLRILFNKTPNSESKLKKSSVKEERKSPKSVPAKHSKTPKSALKLLPRKLISESKTPTKSVKSSPKTPGSAKSLKKTPLSSKVTQKTPQSSKLTLKTPQSSKLIQKTPKSSKLTQKTPQSSKLTQKTPQSLKLTQKTPQSTKTTTKTPQSAKLIAKTPKSSIALKTPKSEKSVPKTPQSAKLIAKTPKSSIALKKTPKSAKSVTKTPQSAKLNAKTPKSTISLKKTPKSAKSVTKTPQSAKLNAKTPKSTISLKKSPGSAKSMKKTPQSAKLIAKTPKSTIVLKKTPQSSRVTPNSAKAAKTPKSLEKSSKKTPKVSLFVTSPKTPIGFAVTGSVGKRSAKAVKTLKAELTLNSPIPMQFEESSEIVQSASAIKTPKSLKLSPKKTPRASLVLNSPRTSIQFEVLSEIVSPQSARDITTPKSLVKSSKKTPRASLVLNSPRTPIQFGVLSEIVSPQSARAVKTPKSLEKSRTKTPNASLVLNTPNTSEQFVNLHSVFNTPKSPETRPSPKKTPKNKSPTKLAKRTPRSAKLLKSTPTSMRISKRLIQSAKPLKRLPPSAPKRTPKSAVIVKKVQSAKAARKTPLSANILKKIPQSAKLSRNLLLSNEYSESKIYDLSAVTPKTHFNEDCSSSSTELSVRTPESAFNKPPETPNIKAIKSAKKKCDSITKSIVKRSTAKKRKITDITDSSMKFIKTDLNEDVAQSRMSVDGGLDVSGMTQYLQELHQNSPHNVNSSPRNKLTSPNRTQNISSRSSPKKSASKSISKSIFEESKNISTGSSKTSTPKKSNNRKSYSLLSPSTTQASIDLFNVSDVSLVHNESLASNNLGNITGLSGIHTLPNTSFSNNPAEFGSPRNSPKNTRMSNKMKVTATKMTASITSSPLVSGQQKRLRNSLLQSPRVETVVEFIQKSPRSEPSAVQGLNKLLRSPNLQSLPLNDISSVVNVENTTSEESSTNVERNTRKQKRVAANQKSPLNDLTDVRGLRSLMKTPGQKSSTPKNDLTDVRGVKKLLKTPRRPPKSPENDLRQIVGLKRMYGSPPAVKSPLNDLSDVRGVKTLLKTPGRKVKSPENDLTNIVGLKRMYGSPPLVKSPLNDLSDITGVRNLLKSPGRKMKSPENDLTKIVGVKRMFGSPPAVKSPLNDLTDVRGVRSLMSMRRGVQSPENDLTVIHGVKRMFGSPPAVKSPLNDLSNVKGVRSLMQTPGRKGKSPKNDLTNVGGVKGLMKTPRRKCKTPKNDLTDVSGVKELLDSSISSPRNDLTNAENIEWNTLLVPEAKPKEDLDKTFDDLFNEQKTSDDMNLTVNHTQRTYQRKAKSTTPRNVPSVAVERKSVPYTKKSMVILKWIEEQNQEFKKTKKRSTSPKKMELPPRKRYKQMTEDAQDKPKRLSHHKEGSTDVESVNIVERIVTKAVIEQCEDNLTPQTRALRKTTRNQATPVEALKLVEKTEKKATPASLKRSKRQQVIEDEIVAVIESPRTRSRAGKQNNSSEVKKELKVIHKTTVRNSGTKEMTMESVEIINNSASPNTPAILDVVGLTKASRLNKNKAPKGKKIIGVPEEATVKKVQFDVPAEENVRARNTRRVKTEDPEPEVEAKAPKTRAKASKKTPEPVDEPVKKRTTRKAKIEAEPEVEVVEEPKKKTRGKVKMEVQPEDEVVEEPKKKTRGKVKMEVQPEEEVVEEPKKKTRGKAKTEVVPKVEVPVKRTRGAKKTVEKIEKIVEEVVEKLVEEVVQKPVTEVAKKQTKTRRKITDDAPKEVKTSRARNKKVVEADVSDEKVVATESKRSTRRQVKEVEIEPPSTKSKRAKVDEEAPVRKSARTRSAKV